MKKIFRPASLLFCILMFLVFFFIGIYAAALFGAGKGQMLAGGAIVVGWGVMFALCAFIASFFIAYNFETKLISKINWILLVALIVFYGVTHLRYVQRQKQKEKLEIKQTPKEQTQVAPNLK